MSPTSLLAECGIKTNRKNVSFICPMCGGGRSKEVSCSVNTITGLGHCWRASCGYKFNAPMLYKKMTGKDCEIISSVIASEEKMADIDTRNSFYRALFNKRPLYDKHIDNLLKRGFSLDTIPKYYFSSGWDYKEAISLADGLFGIGVPGYFTNKSSTGTISSTKEGIAMPFLDEFGKIQGIHIRKDDDVRKEGEAKCTYLSSSGKLNGTASKAFLHFAVDRVNNMPVILDGQIYLTEGVMKADLAHALTNKPFISVPGVTCLSEFRKYLSSGRLKSLGVKQVNICFDMDYKVNPGVKEALIKTAKLIKKSNISVKIINWDEKYKGIDDYLLSKKVTVS